ncbi:MULTISPECIES: SDR family NAD(P)-dependent oxidoreductase [Pseudarthrobacter]|jgi:short-subunit dehydrogenase|uniref:SDR family NAD(P)-dependent oxidoreductase n=1 Tax=Pseudarthrobacter TaxID=1742993 RepID=UPI00168BD082|nr:MULTISPECIES: SDR family oxidoreductase [Pseudarthrobacter]MDP9997317.1 short-subunit dehydrogenase [Pseudarthrobacter sulfonivorans]QOD03845.1 SDR family oxidoreductase [Pseudarthrobacter sp. BIM B-2242]
MNTPTTALITGASAGLGAEFARQLAARGHHLVLVARDRARLEQTAADLEQRYGTTAEVLPADLTDDAGVAAVVGRLRDATRPVTVLVNNAGSSLLRDFEQNSVQEEQEQLRLHCAAPLELIHAALPGMLERGTGRIINVSSIAAFLPRGSYAAAKAWLLMFSRWANLAYRTRGVTVTAVCPGLTHTEFHDRMGMDKAAVPSWAWLNAERVVREGLADNLRGKAVSVPSKRYKAVAAAARVLPDRLLTGPARRPK